MYPFLERIEMGQGSAEEDHTPEIGRSPEFSRGETLLTTARGVADSRSAQA